MTIARAKPEQLNGMEFDETWYLVAYPDVAKAVRTGEQKSGLGHYLIHGREEGRQPIPPAQKFEVSICAIVKNEARYLMEWIAFHKAIGVDHFYIYDNESTDDTTRILDSFQRLGIVTKILWPNSLPEVAGSGIGPQVPAYNNFLRFSYETEWIGFIDLDEFVVPKTPIDLKSWLRLHEKHSGVGINWRMFGSSGMTNYDQRLVIERFTQRAVADFPANRHVKTFARARQIERVNTHISYMKGGPGGIVDVAGIPIDPGKNGIHDRCSDGAFQINHYFTRSVEEWTDKKNKGRVSRAQNDSAKFRSENEFQTYDRNEVVDLSALKYCEVTRKIIALLNSYAAGDSKDCLALLDDLKLLPARASPLDDK